MISVPRVVRILVGLELLRCRTDRIRLALEPRRPLALGEGVGDCEAHMHHPSVEHRTTCQSAGESLDQSLGLYTDPIRVQFCSDPPHHVVKDSYLPRGC
jgi:hypothetical protein